MQKPSKSSCQICQGPSHGNHFGAVSCRACSAFFRRSVIEKSEEKFKCLRGNSMCQLWSPGKFLCKKCRLKKCYEVGMRRTNFQFNRDKIKIPNSMSTFLSRPAYIIHCSPFEKKQQKPAIIDVTFLIEKATNYLDTVPQTLSDDLKILERLKLEASENENRGSEMETIPVFNLQFFMYYWEIDFLKTVSWMCNFQEFQKLPRAVQLQILKTTWHLRARLDRLCRTARLRRDSKIAKNEFMIGSNSLFDLKKCELDVSWCTKYTNEQIQFFLETSDDWVHNEVVELLVDLKPSKIEEVFMTCQLCFHYAGKRLQGDILIEMDKFLDLISDDLHRYYERKNVKNYAERMMKMMKINNAIQKVIWEKRWKADLAKKFDIYYVDFSHPEMFYDCC